MPVFAAFFLICLLSSVGLPGLNGFIGEVLCLFGIFKANQLWGILGITTIILAAGYLLWMYQRVMHGPVEKEKVKALKDLNKREIVFLIPIVIMMFWMGIYPKPFLSKMETSVTHLLNLVKNKEAIIFSEEKTDIALPEGRVVEDSEQDKSNNKIKEEELR
jgi:NADH-quinone oxidoreductase subunit M